MEIKAKLWLEVNGKPVMGEGRAELLESIDETGSLSESARRLGLSYRYAWGMIREMENNLGKKILLSYRGGTGGGKTRTHSGGKGPAQRVQGKEELFRKCIREC